MVPSSDTYSVFHPLHGASVRFTDFTASTMPLREQFFGSSIGFPVFNYHIYILCIIEMFENMDIRKNASKQLAIAIEWLSSGKLFATYTEKND